MDWLKDPLTSFVIVGAAVFLIAELVSSEEISYDVEIRDADVIRLSEQWVLQMRRPPTDEEFANLIEQFVRDEIYYRESQRLGLDVNDAIVRRRMVQKLTFLTEDIAASAPLEEADLRVYFDANKEDYAVPALYSFTHRYFSPDQRDNAKADAEAALTNKDEDGDPFMMRREYKNRTQRQIRNHFGEEFAAKLASLEPSHVAQGPVESAYGWHTITLSEVKPSHVPSFAEVAEQVATDAEQLARFEANEKYYVDLKARYNVIYPEMLAQ